MSPRTTLRHNGLTLECSFDENGKLQRKIEHANGRSTDYAYLFDEAGHLASVVRNGKYVETYYYNTAGQRIQAHRAQITGNVCSGLMLYDYQGRLIRTGETSFFYNRNGALSRQSDTFGVTSYAYGKDTLLDEAAGTRFGQIRYEYDTRHGVVPARRFRNAYLITEYSWHDPLRLSHYLDHELLLDYKFFYDESGRLDWVRITPMLAADMIRALQDKRMPDFEKWTRKERLRHFLDRNGGVLDLRCGTDQVGTLKLLTDMHGRPVKEIERDSFGVLIYDSFPDLFIPVGFAGGLEDPDTGLVHFGYRDYDPATGRFTAPDPLGDTGGDHDLYDYCVDDPVTMNDPMGLFPPLLAFLAGKALALALGLGGAYGAAKVADSIKSRRDGRESTEAWDSVTTVAPHLAGISAGTGVASLLPAATVMAPGAVTTASQRAAAMLQASKHGEKFINRTTQAMRFAEPFIVPGPPAVASAPGMAGAVANKLAELYRERSEK